ncbi:DUF1565 domain-containing protein [Candidatus Poribacteria bacterium]|nr:DUF1565 domain-containing protein [Candidatus Poribacteria bacterium]
MAHRSSELFRGLNARRIRRIASRWAAGMAFGIVWACAVSGVQASTYRVPEEFLTPQAAMQRAQAGDTIRVGDGIYEGELAVKPGVTIEGAGSGTVFRQGMTVRGAAGVVLRGFRLQGGTNQHHFGIVCEKADVTVENVTVDGYHHGIGAEDSTLAVRGISIRDAFNAGILLTNSSASIQDASVTDGAGNGLIVSESDRLVRIARVVIAGNGLTGIRVSNARVHVRDSRIVDNGLGVSIESGTADFGTRAQPGGNAIFGNRVADLDSQVGGIEARGNFWGSSSQPRRDRVSPNALVEPWLSRDPADGLAVGGRDLAAVRWGSLRAQR